MRTGSRSNPTGDAGTLPPPVRGDPVAVVDVEAYLVDVLRRTHPVRIGRVLRRIEDEVMSAYPADEAAGLLQRAIVVAADPPTDG